MATPELIHGLRCGGHVALRLLGTNQGGFSRDWMIHGGVFVRPGRGRRDAVASDLSASDGEM